MKILRSRKALSPVVASIILIAVTVAVSIAVAAWMGALTFTFMATEQIQITNIQFGGTSTKWIALTVNNTGTSAVTINEAWVLTTKMTNTDLDPTLPKSIEANKGIILTMNYTWNSGSNYACKLLSSKGNQFSYSAYAPT
jgi:flagellin-like protein